jgi:outer membrane protein OmpA-like peptidoglycan-associated protein
MKAKYTLFILLIGLFLISFPQVDYAQSTEKLTVYFKLNDCNLDMLYKAKIDSVIVGRKFHKIQIEAHCDSVGSDNYNDTLSLYRALEIKKYFLSKGINDTLIEIKALGKRFPLNNNENEDEMALNRCAQILFTNSNNTNDLKADTTLFNIDSVKVGSTFVLKNVYFATASHKLDNESQRSIILLAIMLKEYPKLKIEIQGYSDSSKGKDGYDNETGSFNISENRAKEVYNYLIQNGITASRLSYKGYGNTKQYTFEELMKKGIESNCRVEIIITQK